MGRIIVRLNSDFGKSNMEELIISLQENGALKSPRIVDALRAIDRKNFVKEEYKKYAYADEPLPIGAGQTISQPYTVVFMLELLDVREGDTVFEVGYGSGWQTTLLTYLVGGRGHVYAIELIPELYDFGEKNVLAYLELAPRVSLICQDASGGLPAVGGFDRIIVAADVEEVPQTWRDQLKLGGVMVYPSKGSLWRETKGMDAVFSQEEFPGFMFVPFVRK